jgi:hypothetical protein
MLTRFRGQNKSSLGVATWRPGCATPPIGSRTTSANFQVANPVPTKAGERHQSVVFPDSQERVGQRERDIGLGKWLSHAGPVIIVMSFDFLHEYCQFL